MTVPAALLTKFSEFVAASLGLYFPQERRAELERGIITASRELGYPDAEACIEMLTASPLTKEQVETLASYLTVGETYFLREANTFALLEREVLPELVRRHREDRRLRIWSAGCATGEEPYSIALALSRTIPDLKGWDVAILATDINPRFLGKAVQGIYGQWSFRDVPPDVKERYFRKRADDRYEILPSLREMVTFSYLNLAGDVYPSLFNNTNAMDMIFCRNVLMYLAPSAVEQVVRNLYRCLVEGGWLVVSPCEVSKALLAGFSGPVFPGGAFYRRLSGREKCRDDDFSRPPTLREEDRPLRDTKVPSPASGATAGNELAHAFPAPPLSGLPVAESGKARLPDDAYAEAFACHEQGSYAAAEAKLLEILADDPGHRAAMALLARVYANAGRLPEALALSEKTVAADKMNPDYHYLRATILEEQGRVEEARQALRRAVYLNPDFVSAYFTLGNLSRRQGRTRQARKYFQTALDLLGRHGQEEVLAGFDGLTAGRVRDIIQATIQIE